MIAYALHRSFAWNAAHPPRLPARPRGLSRLPTARLFDRPLECPVGIAAGPLPTSAWILAYGRLGYGLLTYGTVRSAARPAWPRPNLVFCRLGDPAVARPRPPRRVDAAALTWAVSLGLPSAEPDAWRADVRRARARLDRAQLLVVSVAGTPGPDGDGDQLADDTARCARWAAEAGADVVEVNLAGPAAAGERPPMVCENLALAAHVTQAVRRAVGGLPAIAKLGATAGPRVLHDLATRLAPSLEGFALVDGLVRRLVTESGAPALPEAGRELAGISGGEVYEHCRIQVEELIAWRKAGAWDRAILAVGGLTTVERVQAALASGANAAMVATAALADPLIGARFRRAPAP